MRGSCRPPRPWKRQTLKVAGCGVLEGCGGLGGEPGLWSFLEGAWRSLDKRPGGFGGLEGCGGPWRPVKVPGASARIGA